ncbi:hypothetical protein PHYSODRAFT_254158 [Phytophthora sojae]|uniref:Uncharacterized protein n=1 Tax=Phytophthora sojae (strain P6497) TaxID=1094619 RepID=G5A928_PHYSP|nr:hypothetical protein PHYSODRAFT_254158 [Phytophthora sojae]EGZ08404.1 hypothetical protein PHYSODRAFT_254158 [Phytophthora sojae]|eukprot:XP_009536576.1 hypothetical protein PHYSODRAFT_254158 [Phytophthora sojae]
MPKDLAKKVLSVDGGLIRAVKAATLRDVNAFNASIRTSSKAAAGTDALYKADKGVDAMWHPRDECSSESERPCKRQKVWVQLMDERTHDVFADTSLQLVTLREDDGIIVEVAEAAQALYDEEQPVGKNCLGHVLPSQLTVY